MNISKTNNVTIISDNDCSSVTQINGISKVKINGGLLVFKANTPYPITIHINKNIAEIDGKGLEILKIKGFEVKHKGQKEVINQPIIKPTKPKMSKPQKKRLIAQMVLGVCAAGFIACTTSGFVYEYKADSAMSKIKDLRAEKETALNVYSKSGEFQHIFKTAMDEATNLYVNNALSYDEYISRINHLNSQEFIESVMHKGVNDALKNEINSINSSIDDLQQTYDKNSNISFGLIGGMVGTGLASITPCVLLSNSLSKY